MIKHGHLFFCLLLGLSCVFTTSLEAQTTSWLQEKVSLKPGITSLKAAIDQLAGQGMSVSYRSDQLPALAIGIPAAPKSFQYWLELILEQTELTYRPIGKERSVVIFPDPVLLNNSYTIHGQVYDGNSGERLILANLYLKNRRQGISTNEDGMYALHLPGGRLELEVSYVGYRTRTLEFVHRRDSVLDIVLLPDLNLLEITVTANSDSMIGVNPDAGGIRLGITETEQLSGPGGEADPLQLARLLPGITTGADGLGGINIRGSESSQNLILLDGVPVYNLNHAGGLFSIFNVQAIRRVDLYKNGFPARYGGRLAGVVDVHTRDGNLYQNEVRLSQSLLATRATIEGPLIAEESSFMASGRYFGASALLPGISRSYKQRQGRDGESAYQLYDFNFKLNHRISEKNHLYFSFYKGLDALSNEAEKRQQITVLGSGSTVFDYDVLESNKLNISWGNTVGALRWNHTFDDRLFGNFKLTYSDLGLRADFMRQDSLVEFGSGVRLGTYAAGIFRSDIRQVGLSFDGQWLPRVGREIRFGYQFNFHSFSPRILASNSTKIELDELDPHDQNRQEPRELNGYLAYVIRKPHLQFRAGLRGQYWHSSDGGNHFNLSPRLLLARRLSPKFHWQATFDATVQAVHLLGSATIGLPTDIWVPSTQKIAPARAYQLSTGVKYKPVPAWEFEVAAYGKQMENLIEYRGGENFTGEWENRLSIGDGTAGGLEFTARKTMGKLRGWVAYTLARTDRTFDQEINFGRTFPYRYDRRHAVSTLLSWFPNKRSSLTLSWRYATGAAYSFSLENFQQPVPTEPSNPDQFVSLVSERNGFRLPPVHRLDLNYRFQLRQRPGSKFTHTFDVGVYNVYDRHNPIYYELRTEYDRVITELVARRGFVQVFIAPVLPVFSYQLHFKGNRKVKPDLPIR